MSSSAAASAARAGAEGVMRDASQVERLGEEVLQLKRALVEIDRRRNQSREARRALQKHCDPDHAVWTNFGPFFCKLPHAEASRLTEKDMEEMDKESAAMHKDVKRRVMQLREIQGQETSSGFELQGMSKELYGSPIQ